MATCVVEISSCRVAMHLILIVLYREIPKNWIMVRVECNGCLLLHVYAKKALILCITYVYTYPHVYSSNVYVCIHRHVYTICVC